MNYVDIMEPVVAINTSHPGNIDKIKPSHNRKDIDSEAVTKPPRAYVRCANTCRNQYPQHSAASTSQRLPHIADLSRSIDSFVCSTLWVLRNTLSRVRNFLRVLLNYLFCR